jgi:hypothetical protein
MFYGDSDSDSEEDANTKGKSKEDEEEEKENLFRDPLDLAPSSPSSRKATSKEPSRPSTSTSTETPSRPGSSRAVAAKRALAQEEKRKARQKNTTTIVVASDSPSRPTTASRDGPPRAISGWGEESQVNINEIPPSEKEREKEREKKVRSPEKVWNFIRSTYSSANQGFNSRKISRREGFGLQL